MWQIADNERRNIGRASGAHRASQRGDRAGDVRGGEHTAGSGARGRAEERVVCAGGRDRDPGAGGEHERVRVSVLRGGEPGVLDGGRRGAGAAGGDSVPRAAGGGCGGSGCAGRRGGDRIWGYAEQQTVYSDRGKVARL